MRTQLLPKSTVAEMLSLHESSLMRLVREGKFPAPIRTGGGRSAVRWRANDVEAWIDSRAAAATEGRAA